MLLGSRVPKEPSHGRDEPVGPGTFPSKLVSSVATVGLAGMTIWGISGTPRRELTKRAQVGRTQALGA
jgi:hypothetical protein